jgi:hypothetical protein
MISCVQPTNASNFPVKCYTRFDSGVLLTVCSDGFYAYTVRDGWYKVSTWQSTKIPQYKVVCRGMNTRSLLPVPRCKGPEMRVFNQ